VNDTLPVRSVSRVMTRVKRDQQVRRAVRRLATIAPHLADPKYRPALQSLARITLLVDRAYETLRERPLLDENGELRPSLDTLRRMIGTQSDLLKAVGLMPTSVLPDSQQHKTLDAVFERIEKVRRQREDQTPAPTAE
jgi:hypothetical protein